MALKNFLQGLGATHLFSFDDNATDFGDSVDPTTLNADARGYDDNIVSLGVSKALIALSNYPNFGKADDNRLDNRNDINGSHGAGNDTSSFNYVTNSRSMFLWFKQLDPIDTPSCIYEQGGGTNNFAFASGIGGAITFQGADAGQPFLIVQSKQVCEQNRPYFICGVWVYKNIDGNSGNELRLLINGVLQQTKNLGGTASFPAHGGDIVVGNTAESLKTYNESTLAFARRSKRINHLGMYNNVILTESECREIFERSVIAEHTISGTVAEQQALLDALSGTTFRDKNLSIRIKQATDQINYRLFIDNIKFIQNEALRDIAIQFVGSGTLTVENVNGADTTETSTPIELDIDGGSTVWTGGGSINILNDNRVRLHTLQDLENKSYDKLILTQTGNYKFTDCIFSEIENVSGGEINIITNRSVPTITNSTGSSTNIINSLLSFRSVASWALYENESDALNRSNAIDSGTTNDVYRFAFFGNITYYVELITSGGLRITKPITVTSNGETAITLSAESSLEELKKFNEQIMKRL